MVAFQQLDFLCQQVCDALSVLDDSGDFEEGLTGYEEAVVFKELWPDDCVGDSGFIFKADKDDAFGGGGSLAADDSAGDSCLFAVGGLAQVCGGQNIVQEWAQVLHRVCADRQSEACVVGIEAFRGGHWLQGWLGCGGVPLQWQSVDRAGGVPQHLAAVISEAVQGTNRAQCFDFIAVNGAAAEKVGQVLKRA